MTELRKMLKFTIAFGFILFCVVSRNSVEGIRNEDDYECPSPGGAFPHEEQCELYYVCVENKATLKNCPANQLFDLVYDGCNYDYLVDCGDRKRPDGENPDSGEPFDCPSPGGAFPHEEQCELYYVCVENRATLKECPAKQLFDLVYDGCNYDYLVDCGDRKRPGGEDPDPGEPFDCPTPGGAFPHEEQCELYYVCVENRATLKECPVKQLFDLVYNGCNHDYLVDCGDRERPDGPVDPEPDFDCPQPNGNFGHPEFCHLYYICSNNMPTEQECQAGTLWDEKLAGCELEDRVDCGDRIRPTRPPTTVPPDGFTCPVAYGYFADPENCAAYYQCYNFFPAYFRCTEGLLYSEELLVCTYPFQVDCGDRPNPWEP